MSDTRVCTQCAQVFVPKFPGRPNLYCSNTCRLRGLHDGNRGEGNGTYVQRVAFRCPRCGTVINLTPHQASTRRYCSRVCADAVRKQIGPDHPLFRRVEMTCQVCGKTRMVKPCRVDEFATCSRRCAGALMQLRQPRTSDLERLVREVLDEMGETHVQQARFDWCTVDFYLPERALILECDGVYWHSMQKVKDRDIERDAFLTGLGFRVVRLNEWGIRYDARLVVERAFHD